MVRVSRRSPNICQEGLRSKHVDTTVKPLYGEQEGAVVGYNPGKPGRPSHTYHSYMVANLRLMLEVEVQPGNQHTSKHSAPDLWGVAGSSWPRAAAEPVAW
jgi:hypothetical protein